MKPIERIVAMVLTAIVAIKAMGCALLLIWMVVFLSWVFALLFLAHTALRSL